MKTLISGKSRTALSALIVLPLLTACAGGRFDTTESTSLVLPPVIQYESGLLKRAAAEVEGGGCPALTELAKDYKHTRDKLRVAQEGLE